MYECYHSLPVLPGEQATARTGPDHRRKPARVEAAGARPCRPEAEQRPGARDSVQLVAERGLRTTGSGPVRRFRCAGFRSRVTRRDRGLDAGKRPTPGPVPCRQRPAIEDGKCACAVRRCDALVGAAARRQLRPGLPRPAILGGLVGCGRRVRAASASRPRLGVRGDSRDCLFHGTGGLDLAPGGQDARGAAPVVPDSKLRWALLH